MYIALLHYNILHVQKIVYDNKTDEAIIRKILHRPQPKELKKEKTKTKGMAMKVKGTHN